MPTQRQIQMARTEVSLRVSSCVRVQLCWCRLCPPPQLNCAGVRREMPWPGACLELMELLLRATFSED